MASSNTDNPYRVSLSSRTAQPPNGYNKVTFEVSPELVETRTVNYSSLDPVHMPGQIYVFKNTQARTFSVSGAKLISNTPQEAENTLSKLRLLRGWTMPRFGINSSTATAVVQSNQALLNSFANQNSSSLFNDLSLLQPASNGEMLGAPPEVLYFSAYSNTMVSSGSVNGQAIASGHIARVPVVIQSLTIPFPTDVDYIISATTKTAIPLIMSVDVTLLESHSAQEYEQFSLDEYKAGILRGF